MEKYSIPPARAVYAAFCWIASQARNDGQRVPSLRVANDGQRVPSLRGGTTKQSREKQQHWIVSQARNDDACCWIASG